MERHEALALLDLSPAARDAEIHHAGEQRRADLEKRIASAPTIALKAKYRAELARVEAAVHALQNTLPADEDFGDLPVSQKIDDADDAPEESVPEAPDRSQRPPPRRPGGDSPPSRPAPERSGSRSAPSRPPPPPSGRSRPPRRTETSVDPPSAPDSTPPERERVVRQRPAWVPWASAAAAAAAATGCAWLVWSYWWLPRQAAETGALAADVLSQVMAVPAGIQDPAEKMRACAWTAAALGDLGDSQGAEQLLGQARVLLANFQPGTIRNAFECRLIAAQAAKGDVEGALGRLQEIQRQREEAQRASMKLEIGTRAAGATPAAPSASATLIVPVYEDEARRAIAIALARSGHWQQAVDLAGLMADDRCACDALAAAAKALHALGEKEETITVLQTLKNRAARIPEAAQKAAMLCLVAERIQEFVGRSQSDQTKKFVTDALNAAAPGFSNGPPSAASLVAQVRTLRTRWKIKDRQDFDKRMVDITSQAGLLLAPGSQSNPQPDFAARAEVYAALALAWSEAGEEEKAERYIADALGAVNQIQSAAAAAAGNYPREKALAAVLRSLAEMGHHDQAEELRRTMTVQDMVAATGESQAYWLGRHGARERGQEFLRTVPDGEARCRAYVAFQYGVRQAPLERWW